MHPPEIQKFAQALATIDLDEALKRRLMENPRLVLDELNASPPEGMDVEIHENTPDTLHLIFPPDPNSALSDEALMSVVGGSCLPGGFIPTTSCVVSPIGCYP